MKKNTLLLFAVFAASSLSAVVKVDPVFSSDMILQQEKPIPFFGSADPGEKVTVDFAGKKLSAAAGENGAWQIDFPAMKADNKAYTVKISGASNTITMTNIKLGEVWFCSGQSNMYMRLGDKFVRGSTATNCEAESANANYPDIRLAPQKLLISHGKMLPASIDGRGKWQPCTPKSAAVFSAAAYFFARKLHQDLKIPVGVIRASWGGTPAEPWISEDGFRTAGLKKELAEIQKFAFTDEQKKEFESKEAARFAKQMKLWYPFFERAAKTHAKPVAGWEQPGFDDSKWQNGAFFATRNYEIRCFRMKFRLFSWMKNKDLQLVIPKPGEFAEIYINGKPVAEYAPYDAEAKKNINVTLPAKLFNANGDNLIAIRAGFFYRDKTHSVNLLERATLYVDGKKFVIRRRWKMYNEFSTTAKAMRKKAPDFITIPYLHSKFSCNLFNAMVHGWIKLPVRGILWYQGEARAGDPRYYLLLKALINDWRKQWQNPQMPFIIVQLAGYAPERKNDWRTFVEDQPRYAMARDCQQQMLELPGVGLATAIDIGEVDNIHPGNKQDVGKRLALEAERMVYGKDVISRGPMFKSAKVENGTIRVFFDNVYDGLKTSDGKAPGAFFIAGKDKKFVVANAKIDGKTVVVSSDKVPQPEFVRYAYVSFRGDCNLQNSAGLPAYPFRSDKYDFSQLKP